MHYPDQARYARLAAAAAGATFTDLDGGSGYLFAIARGSRSFLSGAGLICSYVVNGAAAYGISRDKGHTKSALAARGIAVIEGRHFFLRRDMAKLRSPGHELADAAPYAAGLGYPVFAKPLRGARGDFAEILAGADDLAGYAARIGRSTHDAFLVERYVAGDEHRVVVKDGVPLFWSRKDAAALTGDGTSTLAALLDAFNARLDGTGISPVPLSQLPASGPSADAIPPAGTRIPLSGRRNLSAAGTVSHIDLAVPPPLAAIAIAAVAAIGLRLGAVDIFDISPSRDLSALVVIEVNGNPALRTLEDAGHLDLIVGLWRSMIDEALGT